MAAKFYYSKPDGEDLVGKSLLCAKRGAVGGAFITMFHMMKIKGPVTTTMLAVIGLRHMLYVGGAGFVFATGTYMATRLRRKDDKYNHFIGTIFTAPVWKSYLKLPGTEIAQIVFIVGLLLLANKHRTNVPSGHETPFNYIYNGVINRNPQWELWK